MIEPLKDHIIEVTSKGEPRISKEPSTREIVDKLSEVVEVVNKLSSANNIYSTLREIEIEEATASESVNLEPPEHCKIAIIFELQSLLEDDSDISFHDLISNRIQELSND